MRNLVVIVLLASTNCLLLVAGCGENATPECVPACPTGTHCSDSGCIPDDPNVDLSHPGGNDDLSMPGGCQPACANPTPYCSPQSRCVVCLTDENCPSG